MTTRPPNEALGVDGADRDGFTDYWDRIVAQHHGVPKDHDHIPGQLRTGRADPGRGSPAGAGAGRSVRVVSILGRFRSRDGHWLIEVHSERPAFRVFLDGVPVGEYVTWPAAVEATGLSVANFVEE